ncbi:hypothetical protein [Actinorugispora endophytica]|uniref:Uncharacterized protein n=1 Tax=Actinorugispora endophytica TaxID=1605990 RepID=A0A4R6V3N7_9ACTN|nr:hypothetical protein [Actinorugispora endophytica]TDQ54783.1 hypothetical protein EV190_10199 [Actinorugispora endophytica]
MSEKQGLHGVKAFLVMVGSGALAALIAVGGLVLVVNSIGSAVVDGPSGGDTEGQVGSWEPAPSMTEGALNLCQTLETSAQAGAFRSMGPERIDSGDGYSDPGPGVDSRIIRDNCTWEIYSPDGMEWKFSLEYEALAGGESESMRVDSAENVFSLKKESLREDFASVVNEEIMGDMAEESYAVYGSKEEGGVLYAFLGRTRSGVFRIDLKAPPSASENVDIESEFRILVRKTVPVVHSRLERILPG